MKIEELIRDKNIKLTTSRVRLLEILEKADRPLCHEEIKNHISMDKATFCRNISKFEDDRLSSLLHIPNTKGDNFNEVKTIC